MLSISGNFFQNIIGAVLIGVLISLFTTAIIYLVRKSIYTMTEVDKINKTLKIIKRRLNIRDEEEDE